MRMDMGGMCEWRNLLFSGQPLWISPHLGLGAPFAFDPLQGVFYPIKWLYFWLPGYLATDAHVAAHFAIACAGAALLARTFGLSRRASLLLGLAYLFSGTLIDLARHSPYLIGGAWLPWSWAFARLSLRRPSLRRGSGLVLSLGLMLLGGDAFTWLWGFVIAWGEALAALVKLGRWKRSARVAALAILGGAVGLVVWLPAWRELSVTGRHDGINLESALRWSWSLRDLPGVFLAGIFQQGRLLGGNLWSFLHQSRGNFPWNESPFLGVLALMGCLLGMGQSRVRVATGVLLISFVLALGSALPFAGWLYRAIPALTNLRYPAKHLVVVNLSALILAGHFYTRVLNLNGRHGRNFARAVVVCFLAALVAWVGSRGFWLEQTQKIAAASGWAWTNEAPTAWGVLGWALVPFGVATLALWFVVRSSRLSTPMLFLAPVILELFCAAFMNVAWLSPEQSELRVFSPLKFIADDFKKRAGLDAVFCLSNQVETIGLTQRSLEGSEDLASLLIYQRIVAMPQMNACDQVAIAHGYSIIAHGIQRELQNNLDQLPSAPRALGCTHFVELTRDKRLPPGVTEVIAGVSEGGSIVAREISDPIPQYFSVGRLHLIRSDGEYAGLARADLKSEDLLSHVRFFDGVVEPSGDGAAGTIPVAGSSLSSARYRVEFRWTQAPAVVGVRTIYAPGWRAYQSGKELPTVAAAGIFLGAYVRSPASGPVDFVYEPYR